MLAISPHGCHSDRDATTAPAIHFDAQFSRHAYAGLAQEHEEAGEFAEGSCRRAAGAAMESTALDLAAPGASTLSPMLLTDADVAVAAAEAGAAVVRARYGASLARLEKAQGDFATAADIEAETAIINVLRSARPSDAVLAEESGHTGPAVADRRWLVDPLCGTVNYAAQTALVAVNVALRAGPDVTVAASADPFAREVFWTEGKRAYVRRDGVDELLAPSADSRLVEANLDPPFPNGPAFRAVKLLADPEFADRFRPRVVSTTLALAWVAAGRRAAYLTDGHLEDSVHFASGIALCLAAGCVVTSLQGQPLHTGVRGLIAAADHETHAALLSLIGRQFPSRANSTAAK
jgi:myo-inositol-1(or 4)-monophosphatase